ncbi:hypothetical protein HNP46_006766 [Pseudomonas nitritireducens]|uniref:Uncharacterized protein n=1 Tax=Pseudomonas nitroreducens TaxID=46680 RepID=A0A7W7P612_PSENT|nr:hypothetical protein [Pseudomonas nitritireducens]MBB4867847.1 hypothetical protein [Pseudomonas nitritireducens]
MAIPQKEEQQSVEHTIGERTFNAVRVDSHSPWHITFPEGDRHFYGGVSELKAEMKVINAQIEATEAEAVEQGQAQAES